MDLNTQLKEFNEQKREYHLCNTTEERKTELMKAMKESLKEMNGGKDDYAFKMIIEGEVRSIKDCTEPEELYEILGDISLASRSDKMSEISHEMRSKSMSRNKYSEKNPYPDK